MHKNVINRFLNMTKGQYVQVQSCKGDSQLGTLHRECNPSSIISILSLETLCLFPPLNGIHGVGSMGVMKILLYHSCKKVECTENTFCKMYIAFANAETSSMFAFMSL